MNTASRKWLRPVLLIAAAVIILIIVLVTQSPGESLEVSFFPVQKEAAREAMQVLLQGDLVLDSSGCLRVHDHLILWPYGYSVNIKGDEIHVIDDKGQIVGRVGEFVKLGGGNIPAFFAEEKLGYPLPEGCDVYKNR